MFEEEKVQTSAGKAIVSTKAKGSTNLKTVSRLKQPSIANISLSASRNNETLESVLAMVEASQDREREAVQELQVVKRRVKEEKSKTKQVLRENKLNLQQREKDLIDRVNQKEQKFERENKALVQALEKRDMHIANLREQLAIAMKNQNLKQDIWEGRLVELEKGVKALIVSTTDAMEDMEERLGTELYCSDCTEKSDEIEKLRNKLKDSEGLLLNQLKDHSELVVKLQEENNRLESDLEVQSDKFQELLTEANITHARSEEIAALVIKQRTEEIAKIQQEKQEGIKSCQSILRTAETNYSEQIESSKTSVRLLREMLEAEKLAFSEYRERMAKEKAALEREIGHLRTQSEKEKEVFNLSEKSVLREKQQVELTLKEHEFEIHNLKLENARLAQKVSEIESHEAEGIDLLSLWKKRTQIGEDPVKDPSEKAKKRLEKKEKRKRDKENAQASRLVLLTELQMLRTTQAKHEERVREILQEKEWLKKERIAVSEGLQRQQESVQEQLKVINLLRESLQIACAERSMIIKHNVRSLDEIRETIELQHHE